MTLAASVVQASMITPSRSYRTRNRRSPLSQLIVRSTTQRTLPSPLPCGVFRLAMCGSIPSQRSLGRHRRPGRAGPGPQPGRVRDQDPRAPSTALGHPVELILTGGPGVGHRPGRGAAGRPRAGGGDRRQGVRQEGAGRGDRAARGRGGDPDPEEPEGAAGDRPAPVPGAEPGRAVLVARSSSTGGWRPGTTRRRPTSWPS